QAPAFFAFAGTVLPLGYLPQKEYRYRQVLVPSADPDRVPAEWPGLRYHRIAQTVTAWRLALPSAGPAVVAHAVGSSVVAALVAPARPRGHPPGVGGGEGGGGRFARLAEQGVGPDLKEWTARLVCRLAADARYGLSGEGLAPAPGAPDEVLNLPESQWEAV